jgi:hypothetical protein
MISRRGTEVLTAALTGAFGAAVMVSSLDNGISWSTEGVGAGTFPFITGLLILGGSVVNLAIGWAEGGAVLLDRAKLVRLARLFVPAAVFVAAIPLVGMYVASALYVWSTVSVQGRRPHLHGIALAVLFVGFLYVVFERTFQVELPRGMLGAALGF